ncbi:MAG: GNAT family N-acetyltransferase, partial [Planctomycetota bacterium]
MSESPSFEIEAVAEPWDGWDERTRQLAGAGLFHRAGWLRLWRRVYGQEGIGLIARREGRDVAALPLVRKASRIFGRYWVSMPYFDAAGPAGDPRAAGALCDRALDLARRRGDGRVEVRTSEPGEWGWACSTRKVHVSLDLPPTRGELLGGLKAKLRSQVRRAGREGPCVVQGGAELMGELFDVYSERMRELGSPGHSLGVFRGITEEFPEESHLTVIRLGGRCVSGAFLLADGDRIVIPWAATLSRVNPLSINMSLYFEALAWAVERGAARFDFGRCDEGSSHLRFKLQWGGIADRLYWHRATTSGARPPEGYRRDPRLRLASRIWRRLPLALTRRAGHLLMRHLS